MRSRAWLACAAWPLLLSTAGCSWSRFDDVSENAPIVLLDRPKEISGGFGSSLAAAKVGDDVTLLVGGSPLTSGGAEFKLGTDESPGLAARDTGHCLGGDAPCYFSSSPVALARAKGPAKKPEALCFVDGAGTAGNDETGVVVRCADTDVEYALDVPPYAADLLKFSFEHTQPTLFRFGADRGPDPALLASADEERDVWYYPSLQRDYVSIPNPESSKGWEYPEKRTLAVARIGDEARLLAVGEPEQGRVRLFFAPDGVTPSYIGCLGGSSGFGRAFATGPVLAGGDDDLVVSDDSLVYVFDAAKLATLPATEGTDCSLAALPEGSLLTSFTCGSTKNISGCDSSEFGAALAVGDLDGDGDGEVVVGAPGMTVRHVSRAGAVLIYDVEPPKPGSAAHLYDLTDIAFLSSAQEDDELGRSLVLPDLGSRQLLVAGAPGGGKAALFYCPSFLPPELAGARCQ